MKLSYSKPFYNTLNYAPTANIEKVMKFYNIGDKTFETDFNCFVFSDTALQWQKNIAGMTIP